VGRDKKAGWRKEKRKTWHQGGKVWYLGTCRSQRGGEERKGGVKAAAEIPKGAPQGLKPSGKPIPVLSPVPPTTTTPAPPRWCRSPPPERKHSHNQKQWSNEETHPYEADNGGPDVVMRYLPPSTSVHYRALIHDSSDQVDEGKNSHTVTNTSALLLFHTCVLFFPREDSRGLR
jgi:hypothetical protein